MTQIWLRSFSVIVSVLALERGYSQVQTIDSLSKALQSSISVRARVFTLASISSHFQRIDFGKAVAYADTALAVASAANDPGSLAIGLSNRADVHWINGEYAPSIDLNQQAIDIRQKLDDLEGIAFNHQKIALNYYYKADYDEAIHFYHRALEEFKRIGNVRQQCSTLNQIALVYNKTGRYDSAAKYLYRFANERRKLPGYKGRTYNLVESTPLFRTKEYFRVELELQLNALEQLLTKGSDRDILLTYLNIADSYRELDEHEENLKYLKLADNYYLRLGWMRNYYGLGNSFLRLKKPDSAIQYFAEGIKVTERKGTQISRMAVYTGLGEAYAMKEDYLRALKYLKKGLQLTSEMGNRLDVVLTMQRIEDVYIEMQDWESAKYYCEASLGLAREIHAMNQVRDGLFCKAKLLATLGRHDEAFRVQSQAQALADSLIRGEADLQFAQMQAQLELDKKEQDIRDLNQHRLLQEAQLRNKDLLIYGGVISLVLCVLLIVSTYRRYIQKHEANKLLQSQKKQIETLLAEIHHRVKNNLQVISSLLSIQSEQLKNKNARMAVLEGQSRVQAMGLIHENIYNADNFAFINMDEYLNKLSLVLTASFGMSHVQIEVRTDHHLVDVDTAVPLGLIVNELITNSLKHAFNGMPDPQIAINLHLANDETLTLKVTDNGRGFLIPAGKESFGLRLVKELAAQLGGTIEFVRDQGFCVVVRLTKFKLAA